MGIMSLLRMAPIEHSNELLKEMKLLAEWGWNFVIVARAWPTYEVLLNLLNSCNQKSTQGSHIAQINIAYPHCKIWGKCQFNQKNIKHYWQRNWAHFFHRFPNPTWLNLIKDLLTCNQRSSEINGPQCSLPSINFKVQIQILDLKAYTMPWQGMQVRGALQQGNHSQTWKLNRNTQPTIMKRKSRINRENMTHWLGMWALQTKICNL